MSTGRARYLVTIVSAMTIKKFCPGALRKAMTSTKECNVQISVPEPRKKINTKTFEQELGRRASSLFRFKSLLIPAAVCPLSFSVSSRTCLVAKQ